MNTATKKLTADWLERSISNEPITESNNIEIDNASDHIDIRRRLWNST